MSRSRRRTSRCGSPIPRTTRAGSRSARRARGRSRSIAKGKTAFVLELRRSGTTSSRSATARASRSSRVTWGAAGPTAASVLGAEVAVGFTGQPISRCRGVGARRLVARRRSSSCPSHLPAYWQAQARAGDRRQRRRGAHAQRQLMVAFAALADRSSLFATYEALRAHGGVELGDVALASGGIATALDRRAARDRARVGAAGTARALPARVARAIARLPSPERLAPASTTGLVGALWQLREIAAVCSGGQDREPRSIGWSRWATARCSCG